MRYSYGLFIALHMATASAAHAADFNVWNLPIDPYHKSDDIWGLASFSIFQTKNGAESLVKKFSSHIGDCPDCSRGIGLNCRVKGKTGDGINLEQCHKILSGGIGYRLFQAKHGISPRIKNLSRMKLPPAQTGESEILADGQPVNYIFTADPAHGNPLDTIRLEISVWYKQAQPKPSEQLPIFERDLPNQLAKACTEGAKTLVNQIAEVDPNTKPYRGRSGLTKTRFSKATIWNAAPHDGIATYFATEPMQDGWGCDYQVDMAMYVKPEPEPSYCSLAALRFLMCSR